MVRNTKRRKRGGRARKGSKGTIVGLALMFLSIVIVVSGMFFYEKTSKSRLRDEFGCLPAGLPEHRVVVFDKSDALNPVQKKSIRSHFDSLIETASVNSLFSLYVIDANSSPITRRILNRCKPKPVEDVNRLTENERFVDNQWQQEFIKPLDEAIDLLLNNNSSETSPIMEGIQAVSLDLNTAPREADVRTMYIVSDMIQNTEGLNQYSGVSDFVKFKENQYFQKIRSDLGGTSVEILYVGREGREQIQTTRHGAFWEAYFNAMNSQLERIERIIGE